MMRMVAGVGLGTAAGLMLVALGGAQQLANDRLTVTVNAQVLRPPQPSVATHVTVVTPTGKFEPEAGWQQNVTAGQLSPTTGFA